MRVSNAVPGQPPRGFTKPHAPSRSRDIRRGAIWRHCVKTSEIVSSSASGTPESRQNEFTATLIMYRCVRDGRSDDRADIIPSSIADSCNSVKLPRQHSEQSDGVQADKEKGFEATHIQDPAALGRALQSPWEPRTSHDYSHPSIHPTNHTSVHPSIHSPLQQWHFRPPENTLSCYLVASRLLAHPTSHTHSASPPTTSSC